MARIPQPYRQAMKTWTLANAHKAVHTSPVFNITPENPEGETVDYVDLSELALRLGRKIHKAAPELRGTFDLEDLEELLDDKKTLIMEAAGVTEHGTGPRAYTDYRDEDPDA